MSSEMNVQAVQILQLHGPRLSEPPRAQAVASVAKDVSTAKDVSGAKNVSDVKNVGAIDKIDGDKKLPGLEIGSQRISDQEPDEKEVKIAVQELNKMAQSMRRDIQFRVDDETGQMVIKVLDHETKEVIRQIPSEEIIELARHMSELDGDKGTLLEVEA